MANETLPEDKILRECVDLALDSDCKKLRFGAVLYDEGSEKIIARSFNRIMGPFAHLCEKECIRNSIPSRTESMIGACSHAEERLLITGATLGYDLSTCEIYVQGIRMKEDGQFDLLTKNQKTFTCIRCATQMHIGGLRAINIWLEEEWHPISPSAAMVQAFNYASGAWVPDSA